MRHLSHWTSELLLAHLRVGDEVAAHRFARRCEQLGLTPAARWAELLAAVFALGAAYPVRTAAIFGVGLVLRLVLGFPTAYALNKVNLWITPLVSRSWLDYNVQWSWATIGWALCHCAIGLAVSLLDRQIAVATIVGLISFLAVRCVSDVIFAILGGVPFAIGVCWPVLLFVSESVGLLYGLRLSLTFASVKHDSDAAFPEQ